VWEDKIFGSLFISCTKSMGLLRVNSGRGLIRLCRKALSFLTSKIVASARRWERKNILQYKGPTFYRRNGPVFAYHFYTCLTQSSRLRMSKGRRCKQSMLRSLS